MSEIVKSLLRPIIGPLYRLVLKNVASKIEMEINSRSNTITCATEFVVFNQVEGDYLEFGVYSGKSFTESYRGLERNKKILQEEGLSLQHDQYEYLKTETRFFAFDSFQGFPEFSGQDLTSKIPEHWKAGDVSMGEEDFLQILESNGLDLSLVKTIKGWYDETLTSDLKDTLSLRKAALIHIDCDLYESTVPCLDFITDLIQDGTVIVFDDWYRYKNDPDLGVQGATNNWLKRNPHLNLTELASYRAKSIAFIVNVR